MTDLASHPSDRPMSPGQQKSEKPPVYRPGYEVTAERILELIAQRRLEPGQRLPTEVELAETLAVSRTVLREALKILTALGRVKAQKGRGLFVANDSGFLGAEAAHFMPVNVDHVYQLFEFRRTLETETARLAAQRATPSELRVLERGVELSRRGALSENNDVFGAADDAFHAGVTAAAHNPFLASALESAWRLQNQSLVLGLERDAPLPLTQAAEEHAAIYEAIRNGRPDEAAAASAIHVDCAMHRYAAELQRRVFGS